MPEHQPRAHISISVDDGVKEVAQNNSEIDHVVALSVNSLSFLVLDPKKSLVGKYRPLKHKVNTSENKGFDRIFTLNCTHISIFFTLAEKHPEVRSLNGGKSFAINQFL